MPDSAESIGRLAPDAAQDSLIEQTIRFVWECLIPWRDDPEREFAEAEEDLNGQFQKFLQASAYDDFPMVVFDREERQEGRRRVDLSVSPRRETWIEGKLHTKYTPFLVIEGKRLPPPSNDREREYVVGNGKLSGGIQRFKLGLHGKDHETAIILGYLQQGTPQEWHPRLNGWISELADNLPEEWSDNERLSELEPPNAEIRSRCDSTHPRSAACDRNDIRILHFWIQCPSPS